MNNNNNKNNVLPILKWAGGKRQLLPILRTHYPREYNTYFEPFLGAGAVLLDLQPEHAIVNDINEELINVYNNVQNNAENLINVLETYENDKDLFYSIRGLDRLPIYQFLDPVLRASRILFLNKTCFNGLYRVNKSGHFNVPFGNYKNPNIINEEGILSLHNYFENNEVILLNTDFKVALDTASKGDFVYLDPPYDPVNKTSAFTSYSNDGFTKDDQINLYKTFCELHDRGCKLLLSNSATEFILDLYKDFKIELVDASRNINSKGEGRGKVKEVLVKNYD